MLFFKVPFRRPHQLLPRKGDKNGWKQKHGIQLSGKRRPGASTRLF
jgi:hypothetical protein